MKNVMEDMNKFRPQSPIKTRRNLFTYMATYLHNNTYIYDIMAKTNILNANEQNNFITNE